MWVRTSLLGILLWHLLPDISHAQLVGGNASYTLRGSVVNSVTGEPIQRVLVQLQGNLQHHMLTGPDGKFEFQNVAAGVAYVALQKPGYFPELPRSRQGQPTFLTVGPNQPPAVLKLMPEAVISGHVLGDGGEPVDSLPLQVITEQIQNGRKTWIPANNTQTNDLGEFRFAELPPGRYYVFAGPSSFPAFFAPRTRVQARARIRALSGGRPSARGYPGVFYPVAEDRESASVVEVKPGQHIELNFNIASQAFHTISGTVSGYIAGGAGLDLQATNAAGTQLNASFNFDADRGTFKTQWLPSGHYVLSAETRDNDGRASYATLDVNLTTDVTGAHLQLLPGAAVPVTFQVERTRSDTPDVGMTIETRHGRDGVTERRGYEPGRVILTPLDAFAGKRQVQFNSQLAEGENSGSEIPAVPPGTYSVQVYPNGPYYVAEARCGSVNLLEQNLTVGAGAAVQPIEIVLRDDYAQLRVTVKLPPDADSATVLIIPQAGVRQVQNFGVSRPQTEFSLQLAPGAYHVLAVDRADDFEYANPETLRKYGGKARELTIVANQKTEIELELVHVED